MARSNSNTKFSGNLARISGILASTALRITLGGMLVLLGVGFVSDMQGLMEAVPGQGFPLGAFLLAHFIVLAHIGGGLMMLAGFLTRWAAAAQVPILLGALSFVEIGHGFFAHMSTEFTLMVAAMVGVVWALGGGRLSADYLLDHAPSAGPLASEN